jgi:excinuclease UvrABC nuclease subunit
MARYTRDQRHRLGVTAPSTPRPDLAALADALQLGSPPRRMECFDISNISTTHIVASMVCFLDGRPANAQYRRFRIKTVGVRTTSRAWERWFGGDIRACCARVPSAEGEGRVGTRRASR